MGMTINGVPLGTQTAAEAAAGFCRITGMPFEVMRKVNELLG